MATRRKKRKVSKKRKTAKKRRKSTGEIPDKVIRQFANKCKRNKRAAAIYRDVLGCGIR
jgi:hypothetical protein